MQHEDQQKPSSAFAVRVRLLGRAEVVVDSNRPAVPLRGGCRAVLAYLALSPDTPMRRAVIVDQLWQESTVAAGRKMLRTAVWRLSKDIGIGDQLECERDWVVLRTDGHLDCDIWELDRLYATMTTGTAAWDPARLGLDRLFNLYRGDFLEDTDSTWCVVARERYKLIYVTILERLVDLLREGGDHAVADRCCRQLLVWDRANEWAHREQMRSLYLAGKRTAALRQYDACRQALWEEFEVSPSRATEALVAHIRADSPRTAAEGDSSTVLATSQGWLQEVRERLAELLRLIDARVG